MILTRVIRGNWTAENMNKEESPRSVCVLMRTSSLRGTQHSALYVHHFGRDGNGVVIPEYDNEKKMSGFFVWTGLPRDTKIRILDSLCVAGARVTLVNQHI